MSVQKGQMGTFTALFACTSREKIPNPLVTESHCLVRNTAVLFTCLFDIVCHVEILVVLARSVWRLQTLRRKKIKIALLFATSLL